MNNKILDDLEACFGQELSLVSDNLGSLEATIAVMMRELGQGLLQRVVSRQPNGYKGSSMACDCGEAMRFVGHRSKSIHTVFVWIVLRRVYYRCPDCGASCFPYDQASGLGSECLSPGLARACCVVAVDDSFSQTSGKIKELFDQYVSEKTVERVVHQVGAVALRQQDECFESFHKSRQIPSSQSGADRLYIAADGTTVHEKDGWHETKVGSIYWQDEHFQRQERYVGRFDNSETFGFQLWLEACRCGLREAKELVYLGDGAGWIRTIDGQHFKRAVVIVDWYHASENIWDCGKVLFGEGTDATKRWVEHRCALIRDGWKRKLMKDLKEQRKKYRGRKRKAIDTLYNYISVNEQKMRYDVFRAKGYDIGYGAVEGSCKNVVGKRLKQPGMIWTRAGSSATLALRIVWLNKEWEQLWSKKPLVA